MIAVTGATGQVGREVAYMLQNLNISHRLLVRDPEKASFLGHHSSHIVPFDFDRPETYKQALEGVEKLFLVCTTSLSAAFLREGDLKQIIVMSGIGAKESEAHFLGDLEDVVEQTTVPFVALRANWFMQNFGSFFRELITQNHELAFPDGGASISFVDARDIAKVAVTLMTSEIKEKKLAYDITGPESLTHAQVAELFSRHLPYHVSYRKLTEKEAIEELKWDEILINLFRDIRAGLTSPVSDVVQQILGKAPRRFENYIVENRSLWT